MLLQGAYSAKYRAARQEKFETLKDEERQEFNVKLEKTKELSRDTNRRRRALEQRRKDYEAEEEKKRREILAQRKKDIQDATEKFQRASVVKGRKKAIHNHAERTKPGQNVKHDTAGSGLIARHSKTGVNGQPYYPSVEEVLAMLHADRADVIERLANGETHEQSQTRDRIPARDHLQTRDHDYVGEESLTGNKTPESYSIPNGCVGPLEEPEITSEQRIIDQERLRSEVVCRSQPKLAFEDETNNITTGVLPTTIRRNSPSGSLSSLDSLDEVPDEILESAGPEPVCDVMDNTPEGIIRKAGKARTSNRVTFNENVTYNDGFIGTLKTKSESKCDIASESVLAKQQSFFGIETHNNDQEKRNEEFSWTAESSGLIDTRTSKASSECSQAVPTAVKSPPRVAGTGFKTTTSAESEVVTPSDNAEMQKCRNVNNTSHLGRYSVPAQQLEIGVGVPRHAAHLNNGNGHHKTSLGKSYINSEDAIDATSRHERSNAMKIDENIGNGGKPYNGVTGSNLYYRDHSNTRTDSMTRDVSNNGAPFSSINTSMLRDSLDMSYETRKSKPGSSTRSVFGTTSAVSTHVSPELETFASSTIGRQTSTAHLCTDLNTLSRGGGEAEAEVSSDMPLVPVTKKDFLSKALRATNNVDSSSGESNTRTALSDEQETTISSRNQTIVAHDGEQCSSFVPGYKRVSGADQNVGNEWISGEYESEDSKHGTPYDKRKGRGIQSNNRVLGEIPYSGDDPKQIGYNSQVHRQRLLYDLNSDPGIQGQGGTASVHGSTNSAPLRNGDESGRYIEKSKDFSRFTQKSRPVTNNEQRSAKNANNGRLNNGRLNNGRLNNGRLNNTETSALNSGQPVKNTQQGGPRTTNAKPPVRSVLDGGSYTTNSAAAVKGFQDGIYATASGSAVSNVRAGGMYPNGSGIPVNGVQDGTSYTTHVQVQDASVHTTHPQGPPVKSSQERGVYNIASGHLVKNAKKEAVRTAQSRTPVKGVQKGGTYTTFTQGLPKNVQEDGVYTTLTRTGGSAEELLKSVQENIEKITMFPAQYDSTSTNNAAAVLAGKYQSRQRPKMSDQRRTFAKKGSPNGLKSKPTNDRKVNLKAKRFHKHAGESGSTSGKQISNRRNIQYASSPNSTNSEYQTRGTTLTQNHSALHGAISGRSPESEQGNLDSISRPLVSYRPQEAPWENGFKRKQDRNANGLILLDKTPTDEEINTLWETVRTCLKQEQSQKAASDSVVNNIRHSRSESSQQVGHHYLIDSSRWESKPCTITNAFGINSQVSDFRSGTIGGSRSFRRQNSLDSFGRRSSVESVGSPHTRKGSLLEHRTQHNDRRLLRTQQQQPRPAMNPQYFQTVRGPVTSMRGPQKSNTAKTEEAKRPQLSYAEFQVVMQASADLQSRHADDENLRKPQHVVHQPIIMNHRKGPSALSLEEKRLLESLDRLNERLKVQEGVSGKIAQGQRNPVIRGSPSNVSKGSAGNSRFGSRSRPRDFGGSPSLLTRR